MHALPVLWDCFKSSLGDSTFKKAVKDYAGDLADVMGDRELLNKSKGKLNDQQMKQLTEMLK